MLPQKEEARRAFFDFKAKQTAERAKSECALGPMIQQFMKRSTIRTFVSGIDLHTGHHLELVVKPDV